MFLRSFGQRHAGVDVLTLLQTVRWTNCCKNLWRSNPPTYHPPPPIVSRLFVKYFACLKNAEKLILQSSTKCSIRYIWLTFAPQSNKKPSELCMFAFFRARKSHECVSTVTCKRMVSLNIVSFFEIGTPRQTMWVKYDTQWESICLIRFDTVSIIVTFPWQIRDECWPRFRDALWYAMVFSSLIDGL